jgi:hypothetical protein
MSGTCIVDVFVKTTVNWVPAVFKVKSTSAESTTPELVVCEPVNVTVMSARLVAAQVSEIAATAAIAMRNLVVRIG